MGCTSSRYLSKNVEGSETPTPIARCSSLPTFRPSNAKKPQSPENYHVVSLNSSTYGSMIHDNFDRREFYPTTSTADSVEIPAPSFDFRWSEMIESKFTFTPCVTPPNEPETINMWELMDGLEQYSPLYFPSSRDIDRSFSFHSTNRNQIQSQDIAAVSKSKPNTPTKSQGSPPPSVWVQIGEPGSVLSEFDADILNSFRESMHTQDKLPEELEQSPSSPPPPVQIPHKKSSSKITPINTIEGCPPYGEERVVLYTTSLRGIRKTHEDCCATKLILMGYGIAIDERDVAMHSGFREELRALVGEEYVIPRVFIKGKYVGGYEEVKAMHESGELETLLEGLPAAVVGKKCEVCGGVRFMPCEACYGSCKIYEGEDGNGGFVRCLDCNENGLVRCSVCS